MLTSNNANSIREVKRPHVDLVFESVGKLTWLVHHDDSERKSLALKVPSDLKRFKHHTTGILTWLTSYSFPALLKYFNLCLTSFKYNIKSLT